MIIPTLSLLKHLSEDGLGTIGQDLFWEDLAVDKEGIMISSLGEVQEKGTRRVQRFTIYSRGEDKVSGYTKLETIIERINASQICTLPKVRNNSLNVVADKIDNVYIPPLSTITNGGQDSEGKTIWETNGRIEY